MERTRHFFLSTAMLAAVLILSIACSQPEPTTGPPTLSSPTEEGGSASEGELPGSADPTEAPPDESGYPAAGAEVAYPPPAGESPAEAAYPPPPTEEALGGPKGPNFSLDRPLEAGATNVTGEAPGELNLVIVDVTFAGEVLGSGRSDSDGAFSIPVTPLPEGHRIGVTISSLEGEQTMQEFADEYYRYRGEGFTSVPNIGVFFDTAVVQP